MQQKKWLSWLKEGSILLVLILLISIALDWWRKPKELPNFAQQPLQTISGHNTTFAQFSQNRVAVLYFWGSWCGICKHTSPTVDKLRINDIPVLSVALSSGSDEEVRQYLSKHHFQFDTINDPDSSLSKQWRVAVTPTIVLLKNGKILHSTSGISSYWGLRMRIWLSDLFY
ncbi:protein disulfide oxidoreductase [Neisseria canis]|uniref:Periplasmic thioredoxin n=1 Tax=Neisseria canis TaxID=493 RepID=A0A448D5I3_9NEIS|nr:protein disulfide oxidoreductase [Neisseria canis]OSI13371.1 protein disulfide oxidoreductase [Neisseria canis]VEE99345.1 periplasmic thioredoxin [Neisseria canis]